MAPSPSAPYISFVTFGRNDGYAGGPARLQWSIRYLGEQCDEFGLPAELLLVEWNPVDGRPRLAELMEELPSSAKLEIRVITVPTSVHRRFKHADVRPIHGGVAVNAGIRRSHGDFVVVKAADVFYPDALIRFLASRALLRDRLYRTERWDVDPDAAARLGEPREKFLDSCSRHVRVRHGHLPQPSMPFRLPDLFGNACGDFQLLSREQWFRLRGYWETSDVTGFEIDSMLSYSAYAVGIVEELIPGRIPVYKIAHGQSHDHRISVGNDRRSSFLLAIEAVWNHIRYLRGLTFFVRALLNYPTKRYSGIRKPVYERSLIRFKCLSLFPGLNRLKSRHWGLASEVLEERRFSALRS